MFNYKTINTVEIDVCARNDKHCKEEVEKLLQSYGFRLIESEITSTDPVLECNEENIKAVYSEHFVKNLTHDLSSVVHWIKEYIDEPQKVDAVTIVLAHEYNDEGYDYSFADIIPWDKDGEELRISSSKRIGAKLSMDHERTGDSYYVDAELIDLMKRKFPSSDKRWEYYFYENPITDFTIENFQKYMGKYIKQ